MSASSKSGPIGGGRERKRARFDAPERATSGKRSGVLVAAVAGLILLASAYFLAKGGDPSTTVERRPDMSGATSSTPVPTPGPSGASAASAAPISPDGDVFRVPGSAITSEATFFEASSGGVTIPFFAVRDASGRVHVALDACQACARAKKGYTQAGDHMRCRNCGMTFAIAQITDMADKGGCHPIVLPSTTSGDSIVVKASDVAGGAKWF